MTRPLRVDFSHRLLACPAAASQIVRANALHVTDDLVTSKGIERSLELTSRSPGGDPHTVLSRDLRNTLPAGWARARGELHGISLCGSPVRHPLLSSPLSEEKASVTFPCLPFAALTPHSYKELNKHMAIFQEKILHVTTAPSAQGIARQLMILFSPKTLIGPLHEVTKFGRF